MKRLFGRRSRRGQSLVEFALILPIIMFLLLGMVEMGFAINHNSSIVTATRMGARVGASLGNGSSFHHCSDTSGAGTVDAQIIAATEGVLRSPGSPIAIAQVTSIVIFEVTETGAAVASHTNTWTYSVTGGGLPNGDLVPGTSQKLYFTHGTVNWDPATRCGSAPAHGVGVRVNYTYRFLTPLGSILTIFGGNLFSTGQIPMSDQTIMSLEPPSP
jgi:Flp pilus assembly protein TadG